MKKVCVVSRNLLDTSRITESFNGLDLEYMQFSKLGKLVELIDEHPGELTALLDFTMLNSADDIIEFVPNVEDENIKLVIFGPHELMNELTELYPTIKFVARSKFFRDPTKWI